MSPEILTESFKSMSDGLYRVAYYILESEADAEDAVQETYLRLWRQAGRVIAMEQAKGFFVKTLRNVCLNMIRSRRNMTSIEFIGNKTDDLETEQHELLFIEDRLRLRRAIAQLPPKARSMVTMFYLSQMSSQQIAEILGETDANVRSTLSRARVMLKNILLNNEKETRR
jgi:RNA polymerase sigma-70 factor (ECF subfamily)